MTKEQLLESISIIANRSGNQQSSLLELCDNDIDKYIHLESMIARNYSSFVPADKKTVEFLLVNDVKISDLGEKGILPFNQLFRTQHTYLYYRTLESFIFERLKEIEEEIKQLEFTKNDTYVFMGKDCKVLSEKDYLLLSTRLDAQKDILYRCLTGHTNNYKRK